MNRPAPATLGIASIGGLANVAAVLALYARGGYPTLESPTATAVVALTAFSLGSVALFVTAYTRLLAPAIGFVVALAGTIGLEVATPMPEWSELDGYVVVDGPTHISSYANRWYVWLALLLFAGVVEFAIRRGYGIGDRRLRNLPSLPLSRAALVRTVGGVAVLVGMAATLSTLQFGVDPRGTAVVVFIFTAAVTAIALAAVLARGFVLPVVLFALFVPSVLVVDVFVTTDSPVHFLLLGPYAVVLAVAWALEAAVRSRLGGWDGGRFTGRNSA